MIVKTVERMDVMNHTFIEPVAPSSLLLYELLRHRIELSPKEKNRYERLVKGYIGERTFGRILHEKQLTNVLPLFGLLFEVGDTECQIDSILLTNDMIFLIEIKNNSGDFYVQNDKIYSLRTKNEIRDPFAQLERATFLCKSLLKSIEVEMEVRSYVVFPNDEFMLYEAPLHLPMVMPTQVKRFLRKINANAGRLDGRHEKLAQQLVSLHKEKSFYERVPSYELGALRRGIFCWKCGSEFVRANRFSFCCENCRAQFHMNDVLLHAIAEFHFLFPEEKITVKNMLDWCGESFSKNFIRGILNDHLMTKPNGRHTHYSFLDSKEHIKILYRHCFNE